jgi:hypothetical protein
MTSTVIVTELHGTVDVDQVRRRADALHAEVDAVPDGSRVRLLLDLTGYEPASLDAHKAMRDVVPGVLVRHGLRPAFADLFPELPDPEVRVERGVVVEAFANVHHDPEKMARYDELIASPTQRFFTDRAEAERWIRGLSLEADAVPAPSS